MEDRDHSGEMFAQITVLCLASLPFCLEGWCILAVFLWLVLTCQGCDGQNVQSMQGMCAAAVVVTHPKANSSHHCLTLESTAESLNNPATGLPSTERDMTVVCLQCKK